MRFLDWVLEVMTDLAHPEFLRPLYTVTGDELGSAEVAVAVGGVVLVIATGRTLHNVRILRPWREIARSRGSDQVSALPA